MVWIAQTHGVLIGSPQKLDLHFNDILAVISRIDDPFFKDPYLLASTLLLNQAGIKTFVGKHTLIHTDNHPVLEYFSSQSVKAQHHRTNILELLKCRQPAGQLVLAVPNPVLLDQYIKGQPFYIQGILHHNQGQRAQAFRLFQQALAINPGNREIRLFYQYLRQRPHGMGNRSRN
jgi:tetratricopeptide (TPR) repeat protein